MGVRIWLTVALLLAASVLAPWPVGAQDDSEEFVVRIAARLNPDGRVEFGLQRVDDQGGRRDLRLEYARFFPRDVQHARWLTGDSTFMLEPPHYDAHGYDDPGVPPEARGVLVRVTARRSPDGRIEFGLQHRREDLPGDPVYSERLLPPKRYWPPDVTHHRWLYSSEIRFTVIWPRGDGGMEAGSSLESDGDDPGADVGGNATVWDEASCVALITEGEAMVPDECEVLLQHRCREFPDTIECREPDDGG